MKASTKPYCYGLAMNPPPSDSCVEYFVSCWLYHLGGCGNFGSLTLLEEVDH